MGDHIVIVDPYSSAVPLAGRLREHGFIPLAVMSAAKPPRPYVGSMRPDDFDEVIMPPPEGPDVEDLVRRLAPLHPTWIVAGAETGVELADALSARLTPDVANVPHLSAARRDKGPMGEAVADAGLPTARQLSASNADEVARWIEENDLAGTSLVMKPPKSMGTDGVVRVDPGQDWRAAFDGLIGQRNFLDGINEQVLVQEFLRGQEYVVDSYSHDGHHVVANICAYRKLDTARHVAVYDYMEFLPADPTPDGSLVRYAFAVLDAVGIRNGAAHTEVMLTPDGLRLVETGARMHGGGQPEYCRVATGDSQLDRMVAHLTGQPVNGDYELRQTVVVAFLAAFQAGVLSNTAVLEEAAGLPSHYRTVLRFRDGTAVMETCTLDTLLGFVVLASPDRDQVLADYDAVKALERRVVIDPAGASATV